MVLKGNICCLLANSELSGKRKWGRKRTQAVNSHWDHFAIIEDEYVVECIYCESRFPYFTRSSNLWGHIGKCLEYNYALNWKINKKKFIMHELGKLFLKNLYPNAEDEFVKSLSIGG